MLLEEPCFPLRHYVKNHSSSNMHGKCLRAITEQTMNIKATALNQQISQAVMPGLGCLAIKQTLTDDR